MGYYTQTTIVQLSNHLHDHILVEREGYAFLFNLEFEILSYFCTHYQNIGDEVENVEN